MSLLANLDRAYTNNSNPDQIVNHLRCLKWKQLVTLTEAEYASWFGTMLRLVDWMPQGQSWHDLGSYKLVWDFHRLQSLRDLGRYYAIPEEVFRRGVYPSEPNPET